ncbi:hypothetical protein Cob_v004204 [Colletotrichum orbiculare MAFF 240422]|uniref:Uncharacterized protein n=1 Tax=Colletotrichum orbiculare (strain 104-T / ATCC 96160 / CBS 514.97 / LARS 414 / MAFF 240422) TaxID=1213857 RepID=N4VI45_COLOR|nr:hypothetical protein Cob_v004204 [Colletotrichum orbiculare MAFF 240422]
MKFSQPILVLLSLCIVSCPDLAAAADITTVPIYLPHYDAKSWSLVRGSVIASNDKETTYTIFCAPQTPPNCDLALEFPFVFVEGEQTLQFHGTKTSTLIADLGCTLGGTTAATCSGYSSLKSGYSNGLYTGPTEVSWTSSLTGSEVQWGILTLADKPHNTEALPTPAPTDGSNYDDFLYTGTISSGLPAETNPSAASRLEMRWALVTSLATALVAGLIA